MDTLDNSNDSLDDLISSAIDGDEPEAKIDDSELDNALSKALEEPNNEQVEQTDESDEDTEAEASEQKEETETKPDNETQKEVLTAPSSWTAKAKAKFDALPDEVKAEVHKRESDFFKGIEGYKADAEVGQRMQKVLSPYEPLMRAKGIQSEQVVGDMLNAAYRLSQGTPQDKASFLAEIAQQYGADLQSLITTGYNDSENTGKTEYVTKLEQEVNQLKQYLQNQEQTAQQREVQEATQSVESFKNTMENGKPKYPFFDNVRQTMGVLVQASGGKLSLEDAYEQAVMANPETRAIVLESQQAERKAKEEAERAKAAAQARKKASVNVRTGGKQVINSKPNVGTLDETISAIFDDLSNS